MRTKTLIGWMVLLIMITVVVTSIIMKGCDPLDKDREQRDSVATSTYDAKLARDSIRFDSLARKIVSDSIRWQKKESALNQKLLRQKARVVKVTEIVTDSTARAQLVARDSVIETQDSVIQAQKHTIDTVRLNKNAQIAVLKNSLHTEKEYATYWKSEAIDAREKADKKPSNFGIGGSAGLATVVHQGKVMAGPGASFGVVWRLPVKKISIRKLFRR